MRRVGGAEGTDEKLLAEHTEVFFDWEHLALGVEVGDICFEDGTGCYSECFVLNDLKAVD